MDLELLARIQFALTIMFHYLFTPLTIGLGVILVYLEGRYFFCRDEVAHQAARFWTRIFALNFALGVASGIVMEFEFGTNWAAYSRFVGDVFGSALAAEGIFAFFLESGFLAILVFGWDRVSKRMHFISTCMVALGSMFSAVWIVVANSWQQTPAGHHIVPVLQEDGKPWFVDGQPMLRAEIVDFWAMVFNPSSVSRLTHVLIGCFLMGAFLVTSISAWYLLKNRHLEFAKKSFSAALILAAISSWAALINGHSQAVDVYYNQPAKLAAFEAHFHTGPGDLTLFGIPDPERMIIDFKIAIPGALSLLIHGDTKTQVYGLDKFRKEDRPPVWIPFVTWRLMVGLGSFFIALTTLSCFLLWRKELYSKRWLLWLFVITIVPAVLANQAGWVAAEVGRQPWIVHPPVPQTEDKALLLTADDGFVLYDETLGLRTSNALSRAVSAEQVLGSIIGFSLIYALLFFVWLFLLGNKIKKGPEEILSGVKTQPNADFIDTASVHGHIMDT